MIRSIMVGVNGTRCSQSAVNYAVELAKDKKASFVALGVVDVPHLSAPEPVPLGAGAFKTERDEALLAKAHATMDRMLADAHQQGTAAGVTVQTMKLEGNPADILVLESQRVDLLIVGKKHSGNEDWELASNILRSVLHNSSRPVLCIPENPSAGTTVLVAYDGSLQAAKTLQLCVASGLMSGREIHLLTIASDGPAVAQRGIEFLHAHGLKVSVHLEEGNHAAEEILRTADRIQAGLIVMGAYGKPRIREFVFGSATRTILSATKVPLFLYH
jgi:nucleotide-binding universal stress UspA family protein